MPQDYIPRRSSSSQRQAPRRVSSSSSASVRRQQPVHRGRPPRRKSGPPLFPILVLAVVLILAVVIIVLVSRSCSSSEEPAGNNSSAVSAVSGTETSGLTSTASGATDPAATPAPTPSAEPTPAPQEEPQVAPETVGGLLVVEDSAYEYYNFVTDLAKEYITAVVNAGSKLAGKATVYDMVIPTSIDIMLPESYLEKYTSNGSINTSDQKKAIDEYILPSITAQDPSIKTVSIFDTLKAHANEYLYFRTDHHWTQLGAYYGYVEFCKARGFEPVALDQFDRADYTGYLGSFYTATNSAALAANPDTVEAYIPRADVNLSFTQTDGQTVESWPLIADGEQYDTTSKYIAYCAGDQPYEEIVNNDMTEGPSIVVVKESFGNCFLPFLVNHYKTVYVVDYRSYNGTVTDLVNSTGATDVLLLNNISMTRNEGLIDSFSNIF